MNITVRKYYVIENTVPMKSISDLTKGCRVFYELNKPWKYNKSGDIIEWKGKNEFKEINNIEDLINDTHINNYEYINFHNFVILHKNKV